MLLATVPTVLVGVLLHWVTLTQLIRWFRSRQHQNSKPLLIGVLVVLLVHVLEITLFAGVMFGLWHANPDWIGRLEGLEVNAFADVWYFSACVYTTVGFGDIVPTGPGRFFTGIEALVGLLMITWSASFTFLVMQHAWAQRFEEIKAPGR
ncbi:MAG: potassium channel family protein [Planctomycetota bacterium]